MRLDVNLILEKLSKIRPLFHNEADFQFYFAWALKEEGFKIRLEYYTGKENEKRKYIDLVAIDELENKCYLFEFKYKTIETEEIVFGESFEFFNHGARDLGAYAVVKDVDRLEKHIGKEVFGAKAVKGYVIFLTNDLGYYNGFKRTSLCYPYGLEEGKNFISNRRIDFNLGGKRKENTCVSKLSEITLKNNYELHWHNYSLYLKMLVIDVE